MASQAEHAYWRGLHPDPGLGCGPFRDAHILLLGAALLAGLPAAPAQSAPAMPKPGRFTTLDEGSWTPGVDVILVGKHTFTWLGNRLRYDDEEPDDEWRQFAESIRVGPIPIMPMAFDARGDTFAVLIGDATLPLDGRAFAPSVIVTNAIGRVPSRTREFEREKYSPASWSVLSSAGKPKVLQLDAVDCLLDTSAGANPLAVTYGVAVAPNGLGVCTAIGFEDSISLWMNRNMYLPDIDAAKGHLHDRNRLVRTVSGTRPSASRILAAHWTSDDRIVLVAEHSIEVWGLEGVPDPNEEGRGLTMVPKEYVGAPPEKVLGPGTDRPIASLSLDDTPTTVTKFLERDELVLSAPGDKHVRVRLWEDDKPVFYVERLKRPKRRLPFQ